MWLAVQAPGAEGHRPCMALGAGLGSLAASSPRPHHIDWSMVDPQRVICRGAAFIQVLKGLKLSGCPKKTQKSM